MILEIGQRVRVFEKHRGCPNAIGEITQIVNVSVFPLVVQMEDDCRMFQERELSLDLEPKEIPKVLTNVFRIPGGELKFQSTKSAESGESVVLGLPINTGSVKLGLAALMKE